MKKLLLFFLAAICVCPCSTAFAGTTTKDAGATKIHGGDYKCDSFENALKDHSIEAEKLLKYGVLASSAYVDRNDADGMPEHVSKVNGKVEPSSGMNGGQGRVDNWKLVDGVQEMSFDEVSKLLSGNSGKMPEGLHVSTASPKDVEDAKNNADPKKSEKAKAEQARNGWNDVSTVMVSGKDEDGLSVRFFKDGGTLVLSFRGTADGKDIRDDIKQVSHLAPTPQQYKDAAKVLETVLANYDGPIVCTGHSLGGGLVQYAMAANNIMDGNGNARVTGYTYNSAGLNGLVTVNSFDETNAKNASANITGIRSDGDPVSFVGYHLLGDKKMLEVSTEVGPEGEHSIKGLLQNMAASMSVTGKDGKASLAGKIADDSDRAEAARQQAKRDAKNQKNQKNQTIGNAKPAATVQAGQQGGFSALQGSHTGGTVLPVSIKTFLETEISSDPDVQSAFDDAFDKVRIGLDTVLPASTAQDVADKLEELAKQGVIAAGGAVDKAVKAQLDKLKAEILAQMPGDSSKEQMGKLIDDMLAGVGTGNFSMFGSDAADLGVALAGDYASKLVDKLNLPAEEKAALKKTVSDAVQAYINGTGVGTSIQGNVESYVYGKIKSQFGQDVADSWKQAYQTWQGGANPWADIKAAAKKTIETWAFDKLEKVVGSQLKKLLDKHPVLAETFKALGIDAHSIVGTARNIWGVLTGPGTFKDKLQTLSQMAVDGLANMLKSLLHWGIEKLQQWLNGVLSKIGQKIAAWIQNLLGEKFHLSQKIVDMAMKAVNAAIGAGVKAVAALPGKLEPIAGKWIDKGATKVNETIDDAFNPPPSLQRQPVFP